MLSQRLRFSFSNHHQDLDIKIIHIAMHACWDDRSKWEIYNIQKSLERVWHVEKYIWKFLISQRNETKPPVYWEIRNDK